MVDEVSRSRQFTKRVWLEQTAALRSSPINPHRLERTREARLRLEIDLALRAAGARAAEQYRRSRAEAASQSPRGISPRRLPALTNRPQLHGDIASPRLFGPQVATPVADTGSYSSRELESRNCRFKNMTSPLPFFNS